MDLHRERLQQLAEQLRYSLLLKFWRGFGLFRYSTFLNSILVFKNFGGGLDYFGTKPQLFCKW
jgi:hypothetical protein